MMKLVVALLLLSTYVYGYGEPDASGHPNYQERANHVFMNAVRIAPTQYKTVYMAGYSPSPANILTSTYPAVRPLYLEPRLVNAAYYHSNDMATNGCFSHNSCNGTATFTRIRGFYSCSGTMGENIAAGNADALDTNNQWLCDKVGSECALDGASGDGHRRSIMGSGYRVVGTGYAYNAAATYRHYWTQDFGGAACAPAPTSPIYGGSHRVKSGATRFLAVYWTSPAVAPASATVTIGGTAYPLALDIGAAGAGTYFVSQTAGTACRSYFFTIGGFRYPETGCLVTYGEGTCTTSFDATCGGSSATVSSSSSSSSSVSSTVSSTVSSSSSSAASTVTSTGVVTTGVATTGSPSSYYLYTSSLQNSWTNAGAPVTHGFIYSGVAGLKADLTTSQYTKFVWFSRNPAVPNTWTSVKFRIAASASGSVVVFFNGGYSQTKAVTTAWQEYTISMSSLNNPTPVGVNKQLVFSNGGNTAITIYLNNVSFE